MIVGNCFFLGSRSAFPENAQILLCYEVDFPSRRGLIGRNLVNQARGVALHMKKRLDTEEITDPAEIVEIGDFVARSVEFTRARSCLNSGQSVFLAGVIGSGKSFLARLLTVELAAEGRSVLRISASSGLSQTPFAATIKAFGMTNSRSLDAGALLPEIDELFRALAVDREQPILIWVEDAHLLDPESAEWIAGLARDYEAVLLVTIDFGYAVRDTVQRRTVVAFTELWTKGTAERLDLERFDDVSTNHLLDSYMAGAPLDLATRNKIHLRASGVPLLIRELALASGEAGFSDAPGGHIAAAYTSVSARLLDLTRGRLALLTEAQRESIVVIARLGALPHQRVAQLIGSDTLNLLAHGGHIVRDSTRPDLLIAQRLDAESVLAVSSSARFGPVTKQAMAHIMVDRVNGMYLTPLEAGMVAECWLHDGGAMLADAQITFGDETVAEVLVSAAGKANSSGLPQTALAFARESTRIILSSSAAIEMAKSLASLDHLEAALAALEAGKRQNSNPTADLEWLHWAVELRGTLSQESVPALIDEASGWYPGNADVAAEAKLLRLSHLVNFEDFSAQTSIAREIVEDVGVDDLIRLRAAGFLSWLAAHSGDLDALRLGITIAASLEASSPRHPYATISFRDSGLTAFVLSSLARIQVNLDLDTLADEIDARATSALLMLDHSHLALLGAAAGMLALSHGDYSRAEVEFRLAEPRYTGTYGNAFRVRIVSLRAAALALLGRVDEAAQALCSISEQVAPGGSLRYAYDDARVHILAAKGEFPEALAIALRLADQQGLSPLVRVRQLLSAVQLGHPAAAVVAEVVSTAAATNLDSLAAIAAYISALAADDPRAVSVAAELLRSIGMLVESAMAFQDAVTMFNRAGERKQSASAALRLGEVQRLMTGVSAPPPESLDFATLTSRELEVVRLVAEGAGNREIASTLFLSIRTVESHVYRALAKLGITSRQQLDGVTLPA